MAKLYPPYIEGTIPAFYKGTDSSIELSVPYSMNRAVSSSEVQGFSLLLKTVQNNKTLGTFTTNYDSFNMTDIMTFDITSIESRLYVGSFYKIQLAYIDANGSTGYYSTVGIVKYTTYPEIGIEKLSSKDTNAAKEEFTGYYRQEDITTNDQDQKVNNKDVSEKVYSYCFIITDHEGAEISNTGWCLHNTEKDEKNSESYDKFTLNISLTESQTYFIKYGVKTINGLEVYSPSYRILNKTVVTADYALNIIATLNYENGYVQLNLEGEKNNSGNEEQIKGAFLITRTSSLSNFTVWEKLQRFTIEGGIPSNWSMKDFTVEQGITYIYGLQQYNTYGIYSAKTLSEEILVDFEDAFLFDGTRQLKIKYNPKVSSFKTDILEQKLDTIGSKNPFFFRNGNVYYKEFPISGLISYQSDEENLFMDEEDLNLNYKSFQKNTGKLDFSEFRPKTTDLVDYNIYAERKFKLEVLAWLNNGQEKLFRSPGEGNYLVRLMNISFSPEDRLNRMLHTFTATAYEVGECDYDTLSSYNIISIEPEVLYQKRWETVLFPAKLFGTNDLTTSEAYTTYLEYPLWQPICYSGGNLLANHYPVYSIKIENCLPGTVFDLYYDANFTKKDRIVIGVTGNYEINDVYAFGLFFVNTNTDTTQKKVAESFNIVGYQNGIGSYADTQPQLTYSYQANLESSNGFNHIKDTYISEALENVYVISFADAVKTTSYDILSANEYSYEDTQLGNRFFNDRTTLLKFYSLRFKKRPIYIINNDEYFTESTDNEVVSYISHRPLENLITIDPYAFYCIEQHTYTYGTDPLTGEEGELGINGHIWHPADGIEYRSVSATLVKWYLGSNLQRDLDLSSADSDVNSIKNITYDENYCPTNLDYTIKINGMPFKIAPDYEDQSCYEFGYEDDLLKDFNAPAYLASAKKVIVLKTEEEFVIDESFEVDSLELGTGILLIYSSQFNYVEYAEESSVKYLQLKNARLDYNQYSEYVDCLMHGFKISSTQRADIHQCLTTINNEDGTTDYIYPEYLTYEGVDESYEDDDNDFVFEYFNLGETAEYPFRSYISSTIVSDINNYQKYMDITATANTLTSEYNFIIQLNHIFDLTGLYEHVLLPTKQEKYLLYLYHMRQMLESVEVSEE